MQISSHFSKDQFSADSLKGHVHVYSDDFDHPPPRFFLLFTMF